MLRDHIDTFSYLNQATIVLIMSGLSCSDVQLVWTLVLSFYLYYNNYKCEMP